MILDLKSLEQRCNMGFFFFIYSWVPSLVKGYPFEKCLKCTSLTPNNVKGLLIEQYHPRRPRGSQSRREKRRDESFEAQAEEPLGTDSHRTISKQSSGCWLLIGHKKCFVLLCPISEQHLLSSFREFVHDGY